MKRPRQPSKNQACTYCADGRGTTKDHVPPKSFFPKLDNKTVPITVPCCDECHAQTSGTDGTLRNIIVGIKESERHPDVHAELSVKMERALGDPRELKRVLELMQTVELVSPSGIYVGTDWAFNLQGSPVDHFAERIMRALLRHEFGQPFFEGVFGWHPVSEPLPDLIYAGFATVGKARIVHRVFSYGVIGFRDSDEAWAVAQFYGGFEMFIRAKKAHGQSAEASIPISV